MTRLRTGGGACVGETYRDATELLLLYGIYVQHEADAIAAVKCNNQHLAQFLAESAAMRKRLLPLDELLSKPLAHVANVLEALGDVLTATAHTHSDYAPLADAIEV